MLSSEPQHDSAAYQNIVMVQAAIVSRNHAAHAKVWIACYKVAHFCAEAQHRGVVFKVQAAAILDCPLYS